jgi:hypothetical protein
MIKTSANQLSHRIQFLELFVLVLSALFALTATTWQFRGEDELLILQRAHGIVEGIRQLDLRTFVGSTIGSHQPPARNVLVIPFVYALKNQEIALRIPGLILWIATIGVAMRIARILANRQAGIWTGMFLGLSGLFTVTVPHVAAWYVLCIMVFILHLTRHPVEALDCNKGGRKYFYYGNAYLFLATLYFTSAAPMVVLFNCYYLILSLKENRVSFSTIVGTFFPFVVIGSAYFIYAGVFFGIPWVAAKYSLVDGAIGMLAHHIQRGHMTGLNVHSFVLNAKAINGYFLPFFSWYILIIAIGHIYARNRKLLLFIGSQAVIFSFLLRGNTDQHFAYFFIWTVPFGIAALHNYKNARLEKRLLPFFLVGVVIWTAVFHIQRYSEDAYPLKLLETVHSDYSRPPNIRRPINSIVATLRHNLRPGDKITRFGIDGAISMYYFEDDAWVTTPLTWKGKKIICEEDFDNSGDRDIRMVVLGGGNDVCEAIVGKRWAYGESSISVVILDID